MRGTGAGIGATLRALVGVAILQVVTGAGVYAALQTDLSATWPAFAALAAAASALAALWFAALISAERGRAALDLGERHAREREKLREKAEAQRLKDVRALERAAAKVRSGGGRQALKTGIVLGGVVIGGGVLMLSQFITAGLLAIAAAGGGGAGYWLRRRQERAFAQRIETARAVEIEPPKPRKRLLGRGAKAAEDV